ncbi:hypothetical protein LTR66_009584 [Elasticomyces elasticus]|nr:hypothetical protein LTR66_009584 [Elasticomyces elasticus]KAK5009418.1 hypothetical protein LTR28_001141 [Elasticomyces elasticus]
MQPSKRNTAPTRKDGRLIIHFDYDCFYASVFEAENPALKSLPLAVQQKQIIVTCNYEARRRGLHKLQLVRDAKKICPEVIIVLGEDISRFRDASKELYGFLKAFSWNGKVERLGFDEVWMDVTDMVDYNMGLLNSNDLSNSFFQLDRSDPTHGFSFDASDSAGHTFPHVSTIAETSATGVHGGLGIRLRLGSHLAIHLRHQLEQEKGYTSTVGISTTKLISKLVGGLNKPKGQTTLLPPYQMNTEGGPESNVMTFIDSHEIGKIPGIGFKLAQKLREHVLERAPAFDDGLVYGGTKERVSVRDVRTKKDMCPELLEKLLVGPGSPHGIGYKIWCLLHGVDESEVKQARPVPRQISIEDSYIRLDTIDEISKELKMLSRSLIARMRLDLTNDEDRDTPPLSNNNNAVSQFHDTCWNTANRKWLAHPRTLRLTTRPRQPPNPDGTRTRSFKRISHSAPMPTFVLTLTDSVEALAERLVHETLIPMFRKLHPEKAGWNLSLVNVAVTNMAETAGESRTADGRDIGKMFKLQEDVLKDFTIDDYEGAVDLLSVGQAKVSSSTSANPAVDTDAETNSLEDLRHPAQYQTVVDGTDWDDEEDGVDTGLVCQSCGALVPSFAILAHQRFHALGD